MKAHEPVPARLLRAARSLRPDRASGSRPVAEVLLPLVTSVLGERLPLRIEFWDGSGLGPEGGAGILRVNSPDAMRRILWAPGELGVARAFVAGDIDFDGPILDVTHALNTTQTGGPRLRLGSLPLGIRTAAQLDLLSRAPAPPKEEARPRGWRHSASRDAQAVTHHYDVGNDFYRLVLGDNMTYSCARFAQPEMTLDEAQEAKIDLICRKLGLHESPGKQLLDVGCGWGTMAIHAASRFGAHVLGITLSEPQAELGRKRAAEAGVSELVEVRVEDYRELRSSRQQFDAISSIGMFEHVGKARMATYFDTLAGLLRPQGRLLNHAISSIGGS
ncbi:MAG: class I SAM-dependent methyltransferase, partial [Acidimicrobiales bacterium]